MKKSLLLVFGLFMIHMASAQLKFGMRGGFSTSDISTDQLKIRNAGDLNELGISATEAGYGIHFGIITQVQINHFFLQPELLLNSNKVEYRIEDFGSAGNIDELKTESFQYLDFPIMIGYKAGIFRLQGGPVGHLFLNSNSELFDIDGYDQKIDEMTWGYQVGLGLDIWKFAIDLKYEGSFEKYGDHINFFGQDYNFGNSPGRFVASLGVFF